MDPKRLVRDRRHALKTPRLEIDLNKIRHNSAAISTMLGLRGISLTGVTKVMMGEPAVARMMLEGGARFIGDSRLENIQRMIHGGIRADYILIRSPMLSQVDEVVSLTHMSFNSEISVIRALSEAALDQNRCHKILLMVELGDLREGVLPKDLAGLVKQTIGLKGVRLAGIGTNLACLSGVMPVQERMVFFSNLVKKVSKRFSLNLELISGGNSANYTWLTQNYDSGCINNLRMGEMIFTGCNILTGEPVPCLYQDTIRLVGEVIEFKIKDSKPKGPVVKNAFGQRPKFENQGRMARAILGLGRQDVNANGLTPLDDVSIIGACSDHLVLDTHKFHPPIGHEFKFSLSYGALLSAMTSPYVKKVFLARPLKY
ncbi:MAG: alanine/ornithine racemase family PLP-dependent enzyme [Desulfobacter sp.]|nr:alanine/ornithine racemase family PLP-dependent enzyme [Desulfobacter sp.]WDP87044.1 MAG: alanine/ornithine racemase family PLP-dependent enzyme [Desulfobacter sp.]